MEHRWLTVAVVCLGTLMIVLDTTIVTVALPSIAADLQLTGRSLAWTLDAYILSFAGFLLLGGRLGDLYGQRRLFLTGIVVFAVASLCGGLSNTAAALVAARAVQGLGGAAVTAVSLSLMLAGLSQPAERARALGIYGFVSAAGGGLGEVLGGLLTRTLNWHWVFLVNVPIGIVVFGLCMVLLPRDARARGSQRLDVAGAIAITGALVLLVDILVRDGEGGWTSGLVGLCASLLVLFIYIETRVSHPLVPLRLMLVRNFAAVNVLGVLWAAGSFAWFVIAALYMQRVLAYDPLRVGLAFVPGELIMGVFSAGLSGRVVTRFGARGPLCIGLLLAAGGLGLLARAPAAGVFAADVLPAMMLLGFGGGMASTPLLLIAMSSAEKEESGLASGIINTSFLIGAALGVALLARLAQGRTGELLHAGMDLLGALNGGYHLAFAVGALLAASAAVLGMLMLGSEAPAGASGINLART